ncbi:MAG: hypothetical protein HN809_09860 [Rhodospirillaceae bacterium]|nr:hypothetical protein [Rhodospirillaceae bacterium]
MNQNNNRGLTGHVYGRPASLVIEKSETIQVTEETKKFKIPPVTYIVGAFAILIVIGIMTS